MLVYSTKQYKRFLLKPRQNKHLNSIYFRTKHSTASVAFTVLSPSWIWTDRNSENKLNNILSCTVWRLFWFKNNRTGGQLSFTAVHFAEQVEKYTLQYIGRRRADHPSFALCSFMWATLSHVGQLQQLTDPAESQPACIKQPAVEVTVPRLTQKSCQGWETARILLYSTSFCWVLYRHNKQDVNVNPSSQALLLPACSVQGQRVGAHLLKSLCELLKNAVKKPIKKEMWKIKWLPNLASVIVLFLSLFSCN